MSKIKSLLSKRRKKTEANVPQKYNGLYQFNHVNIISNSLQSDTILNGCEKSNTLYLEGEVKTKPFGFIFSGKRGSQILSVMNQRLSSNLPESLILAKNVDYEPINKKIVFVELPDTPISKQTFSLGIKWFETNEVSISNYIEKTFRDISFVLLVLDNNAFSFGVISKIIEIMKKKGIQTVILLNLPVILHDSMDQEIITSITTNSISLLSFIHNLMNKKAEESIPFILLDESKILTNISPNVSFEVLQEKMFHREANVILDLMLGSQIASKFYHTDFGSFLKIFENAKGLCNLLSLDIYDNKPLLSKIMKQMKILESIELKEKPTRGYLIIQPGPEGLSVEDYHEMRKQHTNLDVILSIQKRRNNGAIVRGIFTFFNIPKQIMRKFEILSEVIIELLNEEDEVIGYLDTAKLEELWIYDTYKIQKISKEDKNE